MSNNNAFIPASMPRGSKVLILGKRDVGKTALLKCLIKKRNLRHGTVFTHSPEEWSLDKSVDLLTQRGSMKLIKKRCTKYEETGLNHFLVIDEDAELITSLISTQEQDLLDQQVMDLFLVSQEAPPTAKVSDFDYCFIAGQSNTNDFFGTYWKIMCGIHFEQSIQNTLDNLSPYEFLVINRRTPKCPFHFYRPLIC